MKRLSFLRYRALFWLTCLLLSNLLLTQNGFTQTPQPEIIPVKGTIVGSTGEALVGATVTIDGTTIGTAADINGSFSLNAPMGSTLIVSYVSFQTQRLVVTSADPLEIVLMEDLFLLDEAVIVAIGYGSMRRSDLTGAIATIPADGLKGGVITSTEQVLQGRIAGLTVIQGTGDPTRGASLRLRGGTSLTASSDPLIVVDGIPGVDINTVHPSDIVSIDVLKDASAAAIYGSRGANGVIIITTNRSAVGKSISYSGYMAVGQAANYIDLLSANQWRNYVREEEVHNASDYGANTDWQRELHQTSISQSHNVSFSNIGENSGFRASVNFQDNEGIIIRSRLQRLGASLNAHQMGLNNRLKVEVGLNTNLDSWHPINYEIFQRMYNLNPTIPVRDENGEFTNLGGTLYENPVEIATNRIANNNRNRLLGFSKAELEILPGLKSTTQISYELNSFKGDSYLPSYAFWGRSDGGFASKSLGEATNTQIESFLTYDRTIDIHRFNVLGGYSFLENVWEGFGAVRRRFDTDLFTYNNLRAGLDDRADDVYSYKSSARLVSFFGRLNYSYDGRYMATATLRRDGSSRFGVHNKWGLFPSAALAWRISEEAFMDITSDWLYNLKLRAGWGITGNQDAVPPYTSLALYGAGSASYYDAATDTWKQAYGPIQNPNPNLKWESTEQINLGLDFSLFGKLSGMVDVYQKTTSDLLYTYAVPADQFVFGRMLANVGEISNRGVELTLNYNAFQNHNFSWDVDFTAARNVMVINKLSDEQFQTDIVKEGNLHGLTGLSGVFSQIVAEGYPVGTFWGRQTLGVDENGVMTYSPQDTVLGNVQPKFTLGLGMSFSYKAFDASFSTYGMFGQKVLNATAMVLMSDARLPAYNVPDGYFERPVVSSGFISDYWIEDASFLRMQTATIGYTLPLSRTWFGNARIYITGENLFVITNYTGVDPEVSIEGLSHPGIDRFNYYPKPRTFTFGVNLQF